MEPDTNFRQSSEGEIPFETRYTEACEVVRHYSRFVIDVRTLTIVQGLAVIGAVGYLSKDGMHAFAIGGAVFGLFLTYILFSFHRAYLAYFEAALKYILVDLERNGGPWSAYEKARQQKRRERLYKVTHLYGSIIVVTIALVGLIAYNFIGIFY